MKRPMKRHFIVIVMLIVVISTVSAAALSILITALFFPEEDILNKAHLLSVLIRIFLTLLITGLIALVMVISASKRMVSPLEKLTIATREIATATREIAKGNFDIQVREMHRSDEIGQLWRDFNRMARELKSIEYLRKDFVSNVSHEFKTPVASIQGFAKLLKSPGTTEEERSEYIDVIIEESERLSKLSSNILKLTKLENQEIPERPAVFSLDEQIRHTILLLEPEWRKKSLSFDVDMDDASCLGNEELLQQVWTNLIENAVKFSPDSKVICVRLRVREQHVRAQIIDEGIGMDSETLGHIFERFYQGDTSRKAEGNGLGLALVKRIVDMSGGSIRVESKKGKGSVFTVDLPLVPRMDMPLA